METVADWIDRGVAAGRTGDEEALTKIRAEVADLMSAHPAPGLPTD
jgi:glycine hydroxymethyltransferase